MRAKEDIEDVSSELDHANLFASDSSFRHSQVKRDEEEKEKPFQKRDSPEVMPRTFPLRPRPDSKLNWSPRRRPPLFSL
ncbi:hypothetical protein TNCV_3008691 [Trichonephila clavipes]|nr:hypothetical protein TNCV_3008691 [Trichonephila clavipes]